MPEKACSTCLVSGWTYFTFITTGSHSLVQGGGASLALAISSSFIFSRRTSYSALVASMTDKRFSASASASLAFAFIASSSPEPRALRVSVAACAAAAAALRSARAFASAASIAAVASSSAFFAASAFAFFRAASIASASTTAALRASASASVSASSPPKPVGPSASLLSSLLGASSGAAAAAVAAAWRASFSRCHCGLVTSLTRFSFSSIALTSERRRRSFCSGLSCWKSSISSDMSGKPKSLTWLSTSTLTTRCARVTT